MLSKLLMVAFLAVATYGTDVNNKIQPATPTFTTYTYYPSTRNSTPADPADAGFFLTGYILNKPAGTAVLGGVGQGSILAGSIECRNNWLITNIDPGCQIGCRTWSYYYQPDGIFTSNNIYMMLYCSN
ncbi:MAG: hypothetical protein JO154_04840 [Chitinophaga sp.]|uniref:hypothetical protein n=1 Tax=Chitinophaga sp. TaxID=1869181 RepID=UPI0025BA8724|nr:hypothetical protein [Chitinophaga sp.]MBV8251915.1 hypothetical protein [Chitinophaga sp.]